MIQTVDSAKLARRLNESGRPLDVMLEVKLSEEEAKSGADPGELPALIEAVRGLPQSPAAGADDHAALVRRPRGVRGLTSASCGNWRSSMDWRSFRWECRTTWRPPLRRAPPVSASAPRCSGSGRRREHA